MIITSNALLALLSNFLTLTPTIIQFIKIWTYAGWGFIFGNATAKIVSSVAGLSSMAAAVMIAIEMMFSALGIYILGLFYSGTIMPLTILMILSGLVGLIYSSNAFQLLLRRDVFVTKNSK